ncbi:hypothetical protein EVAR_57097_1 [Eumeta japonica]|uniref:Uncharacterized protein n=1 Tax=Eumeta variegata TaxID=151549 RepID=A0A4C1ZAR4_EUMVA|nr:hypothetical protein EVAR_57097_1 [Eumeta japonica]
MREKTAQTPKSNDISIEYFELEIPVRAQDSIVVTVKPKALLRFKFNSSQCISNFGTKERPRSGATPPSAAESKYFLQRERVKYSRARSVARSVATAGRSGLAHSTRVRAMAFFVNILNYSLAPRANEPAVEFY